MSGVFESCLDLTSQGDMEGLLECISNTLESSQTLTTKNMNSYLLVLSGALVFFMQAGFAMLCAGSVRRKNTQNTMLKNLLDACGAAVAFFFVGYAFAFGGDRVSGGGPSDPNRTGSTFLGAEQFVGTGDIDLPFYFFQYTFTAASVTIVAGTLAERCQMAAYLCYSFFLTGFIYPVVAHAGWSNYGFLSPANSNPLLGIGMIDFSGSGIVHLTGGTTALYATYILGSRRGRFYDATTGRPLDVPKPFPGHSVSLQMLGSFILWFGWFGFNPGTALLLVDNPYQAEIGALCAVNTFLASSAGCISALVIKMFLRHRQTGEFSFDLVAAMNGALTGLVSITAGCATVEPWAAIIVGLVGGALYLGASDLLIKCKIDDAVDAVPVHGVGGIWGLLSVGLLSAPERVRQAYGTNEHPGFFYSLSEGHSDASLLGCQVLGTLFICGWTLVTMLPFFLWLNFMGWFRCESVQELVGLDIAYNLGASHHGDAFKGEDEDVKEEYLDAYERYRQTMRDGRAEPKPDAGTDSDS
ncbi:Ammonium transporter 1 member [Seminavis robusta]|uniref:Ammonium transporter n=1 Tax=Seminavis robusta TaxID=568900 RepID=A0A9N8E8H7_9STRA|nr:Ammonium transporter 1 member [Seminavis robusta]|eukprot:Sro737_g195120.1 Ammonium transporter 1 member (526) ;mRNA; f:22454-24300